MEHRDNVSALLTMGRRLSELQPEKSDEVAATGFMVGAVYALHSAAMLHYSDDRNRQQQHALKAEFEGAARALSNGARPEQTWLAGFYFSSGLMRIAALNERVAKMAGHERDLAPQVRRVVNKLKHETDAHVRGDWKIRFSEVVHLTGKLLDELEAIIKARRGV